MAGKTLKALYKQLDGQGFTLLTSFDNSYQPGCMVFEERWDDYDNYGMLSNSVTGALPAVEGPTTVGLVDINRHHEISLQAAVEWLGNSITLNGSPASVRDVVARFEGPVSYRMNLLQLEDLVNAQPEAFWTSAAGKKLQDKKNRVIFQVVMARMSYMFRGAGNVGLVVDGTVPGSPVKVTINAGYQWKNEATIEMKEPMVVGMELAWWDKRRATFRSKD
jgi:hypothetical protein